MTNSEIMLADAEYWGGAISGAELLAEVGETAIARVSYLEKEYGVFENAEGQYHEARDDTRGYLLRVWFSLLIAEAEKTPREQMDTAWPFPACFGNPV